MSFPAFGSPAPQLKRRPRFSELLDMPGVGAPRVGPDIEPMPVVPVPPLESLSDPREEERRRSLRESVGDLASRGVGSLMSLRAPDLKPQPGGNPLGDLPQKGGGKFLGLFGEGGQLRRAGDAAVVGDEGPEMAVRLRGGKVQIVPLDMLMRTGERSQPMGSPEPVEGGGRGVPLTGTPRFIEAMREDPRPPAPVAAAPQGGEFQRPFTRLFEQANGGTLAAADDPQAQGQTPQPPRFSSLNLERSAPRTPDDPLTRRLPEAVRMPPGYAGEGVQRAPGDVVSRDRIADPRAFMRKRLDEIDAQPTNVNTNSRAGGALKSGGRLAARVLAQTGNPWAALGALATGTAVGAFDKTLDERLGEQDDATRMRGRLASMDAREAEGLKLEDQRAGVRLKNAQAGYAELRPDIEAGKAAERAHKSEVARIFGILRAIRGSKLDPENNRRHAKLIADADAAGIPVDAESFNESRGNVVRYTRTSEAHPEQTEVVERNVVTGQETILGVGGYQATRGADGRTTAEVKTDEDRDRGFAAGERHRRVTETQGRERIGISRQGLSLRQAAQDNRFDAATQKRFDSAAKLAAQAERYAAAAESVNLHSKYIDPETKEEKVSNKRMIDSQKLAAQAAALRRQLFAQYPDLFERGDDGRVRMSQSEYRSMFPSLGGGYVGDAQSVGVDLYDADKTGQGTPVASPMHRPSRRGARSGGGGASQAGAAGGGEDPAVRAYADEHGITYDAALRKANADRAKRGMQPIP